MSESVTAAAVAVKAIDSERPAGWYSASVRRQWRLVIVLLIVTSLGAIDRQVIALLVNPIRNTLHISDVQISLLVGAAFAVSNTLFTLPAGYLADRISRRGLIACGVLVWSSLQIACGATSSLTRLFLYRTGVGFGESVTQPCALSMLRSALPPERRGRGFAVQSMGLLGGSALALILGGLIMGAVERSGLDHLPLVGVVRPWQATMILIGLPGLLLPLLLLAVREPPRGPGIETSPEGALRAALRLISRQSGVYIPLLAFQLGMTMLSLSYAAWLPAMMGRAWHLTYAEIGVRVGLTLLVLPPIGLWTAGQFIDLTARRMGLRGPVLVGLAATVLLGLTATVTPLASTLRVFSLLFASQTLVSGIYVPVTASITAIITPAESMGSITGLQYFVVGFLAATLGPTLVATVTETIFSGPRALAEALSLTSGVFALIALAALGRVYQTTLRNRGPAQ